jgi:hypothetical protein
LAAVVQTINGKNQGEIAVGRHRIHEFVAHLYGQVEAGQGAAAAFGVDVLVNVGMIAAQSGHHGAPSLAGVLQGGAHGVPDAHERHRPGGHLPSGTRACSARPQGGKVGAHASALLQGDRAFLQRGEDPLHRVLHHAHDEAVEQGYAPGGAGPGQDAAARQKPLAKQERLESAGPIRIGFGLGHRARHPTKGVGQGGIAAFLSIAQLPNALRDRRQRLAG